MELTLDSVVDVLTLISTVFGAIMMIVKALDATVFALPRNVAEPIANVVAYKPLIDKLIKFFGTDLKKSAITKPLLSTEVDESTSK